jgi:hypothetical protein
MERDWLAGLRAARKPNRNQTQTRTKTSLDPDPVFASHRCKCMVPKFSSGSHFLNGSHISTLSVQSPFSFRAPNSSFLFSKGFWFVPVRASDSKEGENENGSHKLEFISREYEWPE